MQKKYPHKIAVQIFGHLRSYKNCISALKKNLLDRYDCDVFMHCWDVSGYTQNTSVTKDEIAHIKSMYALKDFKMESQKKHEPMRIPCLATSKAQHIDIYAMKNMLYSMQQANHLRKLYQQKKNIKYDIVICIRPDIYLKSPIPLDLFLSEMSVLGASLKNKRFCAVNYNKRQKNYILSTDLASDIITFAEQDTMDAIISALSQIDFVKEQKRFWNPESFYSAVLEERGISSYAITYNYRDNWEIMRPIYLKSLNVRRLRKKIIKIHINKRELRVFLFNFIPKEVFNFEAVFFEKFTIQFCIGIPK